MKKEISIFDLFSTGMGPSSSHTVGPMKAINAFLKEALKKNNFQGVARLKVELYGSLGLTGIGHGTIQAIILGALGKTPSTTSSEEMLHFKKFVESGTLNLLNKKNIEFSLENDFISHKKKSLPYHPNGMGFSLFDENGGLVFQDNYYSIGGGFIESEKKMNSSASNGHKVQLFSSAKSLIQACHDKNVSISELIYEREVALAKSGKIETKIDKLWKIMERGIADGCKTEGYLPGPLKVKRRAPEIYRDLDSKRKSKGEFSISDPLEVLDWVNLYALSINEQNASFGKIVTAPTNGAAGVLPAVIKYFDRFCDYPFGPKIEGIRKILLCSGGIGILYKLNASISGAEVGCQGEVGVACSMAAAGLTEALGGSVDQVENAAEIAMEHNLGLTCDPIGGLVQIPCIERNAMGAVKAINAARMALMGKGDNLISLDKIIKTMMQTGRDMSSQYKETSEGGLAVNIPDC